MLRRSILTIVLATALFSLELTIAGSPATTAITLGLLMLGATAATMIGWQGLKKSIVDELDEGRPTTTSLSFEDRETVWEQQPKAASPRRLEVVTLHETGLVERAVMRERPLAT